MTIKTIFPAFSLQADSDEVLYRQLYLRFKDAIINGSYPPGSRVPSIRTMAQQLNVSRNTVEMAYDLLVGEGLFISNGQAGTSVARQLPRRPIGQQEEPHPASAPSRMLPFQIGVPAQDAFPRKLWSSLSQAYLKDYSNMALGNADRLGYAPLRGAIAAYLNISRGIPCVAEQVIVTSGYRQSLQLLLSGLLENGGSVWTEDPCYPPTRLILEQSRIAHYPLPVDAQGVIVQEARVSAESANVAIVTPANQSPLGMMMSLRRKGELLDWAVNNRGWIIEDDYDSEFCGDSRLAPTVSSLDRDGRTFYLGTFSKTLSPALRLAYVVVPYRQIAHFSQLAANLLDGCPLHSQLILEGMMTQGHYVRHIKKMRTLYNTRRKAMMHALESRLGGRLRVSPDSTGLCLLAHLAPGLSDVEVMTRAEAAGLAVGALSPRALKHDYGQALLLGFANFSSEQEVIPAVDRLALCLG